MHPARQIRRDLVILILLLAALWPDIAGAAQQPPRQPEPAPAQPGTDKKKEARKRPPLSVRTEWTATLPAPAGALAAFDAARAYVPLQNGQLTSLSLADGSIVWTVEAGAGGGVAAGDGLVFLSAGDAIEARDAASGVARWRVPIEGRLVAPPVWQNGWLLSGTDRGTAIMLRAATGERLWERNLAAAMRPGVALAGERVYVALENGHVLALALRTGATVWDRALRSRPTTIAPLDDRLFVGADDKFLYCLSAKNGKTRWRWRTGGSILPTPAIDEDNVYFAALDNVLRALDRGNGSQAWDASLPFRPAAGPFLTGRLLLVSGLAVIRAYQLVDGSEAGSVEMPDALASPPHFLVTRGDEVSPFVVVTREAQVILMAPVGPLLDSKPFPAKPIYPLWPGGDESRNEQ